MCRGTMLATVAVENVEGGKRPSCVLPRLHRIPFLGSTRRSVCDSNYHFFRIFVPRKFRFFPKKSAKFRKKSKKNIAHFEYVRKMLHFGKIGLKSRKNLLNLARIQQNSGKICEIFGKTEKKKNQKFLTKILRLENGAKECTV